MSLWIIIIRMIKIWVIKSEKEENNFHIFLFVKFVDSYIFRSPQNKENFLLIQTFRSSHDEKLSIVCSRLFDERKSFCRSGEEEKSSLAMKSTLDYLFVIVRSAVEARMKSSFLTRN